MALSVEAAPVSTIPKLLAYQRHINADQWFVFWLHDGEILGVTDGETQVYEKQLTTTERRQLAGNVCKSLLADKWIKLFEDRAFSLHFDEDEVKVTLLPEFVNLKRIASDAIAQRIRYILCHLIGPFMALQRKIAAYESKEKLKHFETIAAKRSLSRPAPKIFTNARRKRKEPTGLVFDD